MCRRARRRPVLDSGVHRLESFRFETPGSSATAAARLPIKTSVERLLLIIRPPRWHFNATSRAFGTTLAILAGLSGPDPRDPTGGGSPVKSTSPQRPAATLAWSRLGSPRPSQSCRNLRWACRRERPAVRPAASMLGVAASPRNVRSSSVRTRGLSIELAGDPGRVSSRHDRATASRRSNDRHDGRYRLRLREEHDSRSSLPDESAGLGWIDGLRNGNQSDRGVVSIAAEVLDTVGSGRQCACTHR